MTSRYWTATEWHLNHEAAIKRFHQCAARDIFTPFVWISVPFFYDPEYPWVRQVPPPKRTGGLLDALSGGACCAVQSQRLVSV